MNWKLIFGLSLIAGPVFGAGFGLINGVFAFIASKLIKK